MTKEELEELAKEPVVLSDGSMNPNYVRFWNDLMLQLNEEAEANEREQLLSSVPILPFAANDKNID